ncbi:hypothetical protein CJD36_002520 [Flavipsychrobacter stenotrophus]|uniref:Putative zinc-ribbon domain-containing protein n=1 Tax=Flavipsychrobacter stenotrophus TaxID=2077091 RepID=A0A2S7T1K5_9BACT|nr:zinc ribbon domain-containing protein [Flavipsychrobacter stenotrophus]PQJ12636.1 hypothetical protein CJD36_002520 [Flavipsychrobacter stenotrophus]
MALISCSECGRQISNQAKVCPNCGVPIRLSQVTIEKTSKEVKKMQVMGWVVLMIFVIIGLVAINQNNTVLMGVGSFGIFSVLIYIFYTQIKKWWQHG